MEKFTHRISETEGGAKVGDLLRRLGFSASAIKRLKLMEDGVTLDGGRVFTNARVVPGQLLECRIDDGERTGSVAPSGDLPEIIYEDSYVTVFNKPGGLLTHPSSLDPSAPSLASAYARAFPGAVFHPVTRLDAGTSGIIMTAKSGLAHHLFSGERAGLKKEYLAVCDGEMPDGNGFIDLPISRAEGSLIKRRTDPAGRTALTAYSALKRAGGRTLVRLWALTGRTHQLRVHLSALGYPITGDYLYGTENRDLIGRAALHACRLSFTHPVTGKEISLEAPLPEDMEKLL